MTAPVRRHHFKATVTLLFFMNLWALSTAGADPEPRHFFAQGSLSGGTVTLPNQSSWFGTIGGTFMLGCKDSTFCDRFRPSILNTTTEFSFSSDNYNREQHLPYAKVGVDLLALRLHKNISMSFGNFRFFRAIRMQDESSNIQATAAILRIHNDVDYGRWQGTCGLDIASPGYKNVRYALGSVPFQAIYLAGIEQNCRAALGEKNLKVLLGYRLGFQSSLGKSGAGNPDIPGNFGAVGIEAWAELTPGLWLRAPRVLQNASISSFQISAPAGVRMHRNQECIASLAGTPDCANNMFGQIEVRVGLMFRVFFSPPNQQSSPLQDGPFQEPFNRTPFWL